MLFRTCCQLSVRNRENQQKSAGFDNHLRWRWLRRRRHAKKSSLIQSLTSPWPPSVFHWFLTTQPELVNYFQEKVGHNQMKRQNRIRSEKKNQWAKKPKNWGSVIPSPLHLSAFIRVRIMQISWWANKASGHGLPIPAIVVWGVIWRRFPPSFRTYAPNWLPTKREIPDNICHDNGYSAGETAFKCDCVSLGDNLPAPPPPPLISLIPSSECAAVISTDPCLTAKTRRFPSARPPSSASITNPEGTSTILSIRGSGTVAGEHGTGSTGWNREGRGCWFLNRWVSCRVSLSGNWNDHFKYDNTTPLFDYQKRNWAHFQVSAVHRNNADYKLCGRWKTVSFFFLYIYLYIYCCCCLMFLSLSLSLVCVCECFFSFFVCWTTDSCN